MDLAAEVRLVPHVLRAEVADRALQLALLHVAAPEALALLPVDADEERVDALRLRPEALPELGRRDRHQLDRVVRADARLERVVPEERRGAERRDEVPHRLLDVRREVQVLEAARLVLGGVRLRSGVFWSTWLRRSARALGRWGFRV